jgi:hypothetical protein
MTTNVQGMTGQQLEQAMTDMLIDSTEPGAALDEKAYAALQFEYGFRKGAIDAARGRTTDLADWSAPAREGYAAGADALAAVKRSM